MKNVCFYFQVHQPYRLKNYSRFDKSFDYFNNPKNEEIFKKVAKKCYFPANNLILDLIRKTDGKFKVSYSLTGIFLEQARSFEPELIDSFRELVKTGCVELLDETYYHSISFLIGFDEFKAQVSMHNKLMSDLFNYKPNVFRNTEAVYNDEIGRVVDEMGYKGVLAEGWDNILGWRSPNFLYQHPDKNVKLLLRNYRLSDDIGFRFSEKSWNQFPLTSEKYADWIINTPGENINLFMDYETFGEHQWEDKGIFEFLKYLPQRLINDVSFTNPSQVISSQQPRDRLSVQNYLSWADVDRDLSAWMGNKMQNAAFQKLANLKDKVYLLNDEKILDYWRKLQTSDHFYYMCTKWFNDGDVHKYFNVYESPYLAYINYMNVLNDFTQKVNNLVKK